MQKVLTKKNQQAIEFSQEELAFIVANWRMTDKAFLAAFEERFGPGLTFGYWRAYKTAQGLIKQDQVDWTPEQVAFLKANYQTMGNLEIAEHFGWPSGAREGQKRVWKKMKLMGLKRSPDQILNIKKNNPQSYPEGHIWWSQCHQALLIKINGEQLFYRRWVWENKHGTIPPGMCIVHKNGDPNDCKIWNLEMVDRAEVSRRGVAQATQTLSDKWVASTMTKKSPELKELIKQQPILLAIKRQQLLNNRKIKSIQNGSNNHSNNG